jgi:hypothetical protein
MAQRKAHLIWIEQCKAVQSIKTRFGLKAAFDYIVGEKLLNFAEASSHDPDFARELPRFVSEIRRMFAPGEIQEQLAEIERIQNERIQKEGDTNGLEEDDPLRESPAAAAERVQRFSLIKELLTAATLSTS